MKGNLIINTFIAVAIFSCQKLSPPPHQINFISQSIENEEKYAAENLKILGEVVAVSGQNQSFRELLYKEIEKKFDGDYNVLFRTLINNRAFNNNFLNMRTTSEINDKLNQALKAFQGIAGNNYYPQIYIPFYDELKRKSLLSVDNHPIIVLFIDDSKDTFKGYHLNEDDVLEEVGYFIDEIYAKNNEVWVISLNERVDDQANLIYDYSSSRVSAYGDAMIQTIKIKQHKESWAAGASEVHVRRVVSNSSLSARESHEIKLQGRGENEGDRIVKASRKNVRKKHELAVDFPLVPGWMDMVTTDVVYYVIFEYDSWPTGLRDALWVKGGGANSLLLQYRSADTWYDKAEVSRWNASYYYVNNSGIEFYLSYP